MATDPLADQIQADLGGWSANPKDWTPIVQAASKQYNIPEAVLWGMMQTESGGHTSAVSPSGALGSMQFMPATAQAMGVDNPIDPRQAIPGSAKLLRQTLDANGGDMDNALQQYQGGPDQSKWGPQNAAYPKQVHAAAQQWVKASAGRGTPVEASVTAQAPLGPAASDPLAAQIQRDLGGGEEEAQGGAVAGPAVGKAPVSASPAAPVTSTQAPAPSPPAATWGLPEEINNAVSLGLGPRFSAAVGALGSPQGFGPAYDAARNAQLAGQQAYEAGHPTTSLLSNILGPIPVTTMATGGLGSLAQSGAEALGPAAGQAASWLGGQGGGLLSRIAGGAIQGGTAGALDSGLSQQPLSRQVEIGAGMGSVMGPVLGHLGDMVLPQMSPQVAETAVRAQGQGVELPTGSLVPGTLAAKFAEPATSVDLGNFTRAVGRQIGLDSPTMTKPDLDLARANAGTTLNAASTLTQINPDPLFLNGRPGAAQMANPAGSDLGLRGIAREAATSIPQNSPAWPSIEKTLTAVAAAANRGPIDGSMYQALTRKTGLVGRLINSNDSDQQTYGGMIRDLLDDGLERSSPPGVSDIIRSARRQYAISRALEPAVNNAGASGVLNPQDVRTAFKTSPGPEMEQLSDIAAFLPRPDQTGAPRNTSGGAFAAAMTHTMPAILGAGGGSLIDGGRGALIGAAGGLGVEGLKEGISALVSSQAYKNALIHQALTGGRSAGMQALGLAPTVAGSQLYNKP